MRNQGTGEGLLIRILLTAVLIATIPAPSRGHGGGLDAFGCHYNRQAVGYHCHRGPAAGQEYLSQAVMLRSRAGYFGAVEPVAYDQQNEPQVLEVIQGKVVAIADGDTATILVNDTQYKIRLAEIDTPERGQPYGSRARQALSELIFGKEVTARIQDVDRYGWSSARRNTFSRRFLRCNYLSQSELDGRRGVV